MKTTLANGVESRPVNGQPATFVEFIDHEAMSYRSQGTPEAAFIAEALERLAQLVRWTGATNPTDHADRMEVWDAEIAERHHTDGYAEGFEAGFLAARRHIV